MGHEEHGKLEFHTGFAPEKGGVCRGRRSRTDWSEVVSEWEDKTLRYSCYASPAEVPEQRMRTVRPVQVALRH